MHHNQGSQPIINKYLLRIAGLRDVKKMVSVVWESYTEKSQEPVQLKQVLGSNIGVFVLLWQGV